jgi:hypothetical protein
MVGLAKSREWDDRPPDPRGGRAGNALLVRYILARERGWPMAVRAARFAHAVARRPVGYRPKSPFQPAISAPLDFTVRVAELYTLDRELDRAVVTEGEGALMLSEAPAGAPEMEEMGEGEAAEPPTPPGPGAPRTAPMAARGPAQQLLWNQGRLATESARFRPPWTLGLVKEVHTELLQGLAIPVPPGELRREPYVAADAEGETVFQACPPERIPTELASVLDWVDRYGSTFHPLVPATVLFEAMFSIRPFPRGSLAVGRTMASLYLRYHGLPNVLLTPAAQATYGSPELTFELLLWAEATGSYSELLDHQMDSVVRAYATANRRWLAGSETAAGLGEVPLRLLARARRAPGWFSANEAMRWVGVSSDQTVLRHLNDLVARGILESLGRTRGKRFRLATPPTALPRPTEEKSARTVVALSPTTTGEGRAVRRREPPSRDSGAMERAPPS